MSGIGKLKKRQRRFIFESESNKRWYVLLITGSLGLMITLMLVFFSALGLYFDPNLPRLEAKGTGEMPQISPTETKPPEYVDSINTTNEKYLNQGIEYEPEIHAFYVNWDKNSEQSFRKNIEEIDVLIPQWFGLTPSLEIESDVQKEIADLAKKNDVKVTPLIHNQRDGLWNQETIHKLLHSPQAQQKVIHELHQQIKKYGFDGINIDFENLNPSDRDLLTAFIKELYKVFHADGLTVSIDVPPANKAFDYKELEKYADKIIIMSYDENVLHPGPIASASWFKESLSQISPEKLVAGLGNYGYDWDWETSEAGEAVSFDDVMRLADQADLKVQWDDMSKTPYLKYKDEGKLHEIWFLDSVTFHNQMKMSAEAGAQGVALWRLGTEDPSIWDVIKGHPAEELLTVKNGGNIYSNGEGNVFRAAGNWEEGERSLQFDEAGFIKGQSYLANPKFSEIEHLANRDNKEVVLTFDDGPDPEYTRDILEILNRYDVKASFFIIGKKAMVNQDLVKQIYQEGHEIGNHTFTHPFTNEISDEQLKVELNSTQRIIQGITGRSSVLYRSPYGDEEAKYLQSHFERMRDVTQMGYITVNYDIDSKDWKANDGKEIVDTVMSQVSNGDIILLHDGGGERSATVEALPELIEELQGQGYTFVTISELLGESKDSVMAPVPNAENPIVKSSKVMLFHVTNFNQVIFILLYCVIIILVLRLLLLAFLAIRHKRQVVYPEPDPSYHPAVSVVIAAFNEEKVIGKTIDSILKSRYSNLEVIVVDDGSEDETGQITSKFGSKKVRLIQKENGGKTSAVNLGIRNAKGDIIIAVDADTVVAPDTIARLVRHFSDDRVAAVSGNVRVGNVKNLLTAWQHVEYVTGFNLEKRAFAALGSVTVVPGAIGAWRKQVVEQLGYFAADTLAEDTDMTLKIVRSGYRVLIDEQAYAYTEAPETIGAFLKQRFRWTFGTLQCLWKHKRALRETNQKALGLVALPNMFLFQFVVPSFAPLLDLLFVFGILMGEVKNSVLVFACYLLIDFLICTMAFRMEKLGLKPLLTLFLQRIAYRYLLLFVAWKSILAALKGKRIGWNKLERAGAVKEVPVITGAMTRNMD
ncbi:hypothetical protein WQ57_07000 [Mesobacillus campisalis]|uniref:Uncharacterized protein n=1 Tax=Mesobacillus campisalis TaxID=1408103 RepID=A0A0M2SVY1_9BACI|nr:glycosyltransferase [Mesobacillus campisalis]KKK38729.1 hypothetical protein WQ57_07000 [Mesobacillus campisalis]